MTNTDKTPSPSAHIERRDGLRQRLWPKVKTPVQLITTQLIGWALRKWLG